MNFKVISAITSCLMLCCSAAWADDRAKSDEHFRKGAQLYHEGQYSQAILELQAGYELAPDPVFLVNIALAYAKLGNYAEAGRWARRAAQEPGLDPDAHAQTAARGWAWQTYTAGTEVTANVSAVAATAEPEPELPVLPPPEPRSSLGALGWAGIITGGVGLAGLAGAAVVGATLADDKQAYEEAAASGDRAEYDLYRKRIDNGQMLGRILLFGGAGLAAAGAVLFVIDLTNDAEVAVGPASVGYRLVF